MRCVMSRIDSEDVLSLIDRAGSKEELAARPKSSNGLKR